jgi:putative glutamine amidotransferase
VSGLVVVSASSEERVAPYVAALRAAGIAAERIAVVTPDDAMYAGDRGTAAAREAIAGAAGLVLAGGVDVDPARYGEAPLEGGGLELRPERDALEWELLAGARDRRVATFCVCRGLQVANVFLGGSLYQDIPSQLPGAIGHEVATPVDSLAHAVEPTGATTALGRRLAGALRLVNSRHHQALKRLGAGLVAAAVSRDGLVEAAELPAGEGWWLRGVQWHPENLIALAEQRVLWDDFAAALPV